MIKLFSKTQDMRLSENFFLREFHCKCSECQTTYLDDELVLGLQHLRNIVQVPIIIFRGYSCPNHNKEVGGAPQSLHTMGMAVDIAAKGVGLKELRESSTQVPCFMNGGLGIYSGHIHLDTGGRRTWRANQKAL